MLGDMRNGEFRMSNVNDRRAPIDEVNSSLANHDPPGAKEALSRILEGEYAYVLRKSQPFVREIMQNVFGAMSERRASAGVMAPVTCLNGGKTRRAVQTTAAFTRLYAQPNRAETDRNRQKMAVWPMKARAGKPLFSRSFLRFGRKRRANAHALGNPRSIQLRYWGK